MVPFYAINPGVIEGVSGHWSNGDTVKAVGKLNFTSRTETITKEVDFGEPTEETRTVSVSELILTGGSATPLEGDFAFNSSDIEAALKDRQARLAAAKEKSADKATKSDAPKTNKFANLGF